ncbi:uncharacterized protein A1O9_10025 [Exophiala aquamarina CBS 119918]|uniref:Uncharacterized protein n=1 Tax=Exophiala aquamarina CBS 119918 TaxID=1182545 RepID=A0A072P1B3_9EURO|nr:uncharacterized protein A1O9_10025 [Exophiala aquamarina CBS 119918]KEF53626.1 hypothetical protein A1O9_10025 [Exophiala aquamarina CBS 119918]
MAVFVDLDDDDGQQSHSHWSQKLHLAQPERRQPALSGELKLVDDKTATTQTRDVTPVDPRPADEQVTTNKLAAALTCYPIALSLASRLDLNDLYALASTCRMVHRSLRQYAQHLKARSLRCSRDGTSDEQTHTVDEELHGQEPVIDISIYTAAPTQRFEHPPDLVARAGYQSVPHSLPSPLGISNKIGACARDLVGECRSCGTIVCRNCTIKTPTNAWLRDRYRRLCKTCLDAPFEEHLHPLCSPSDGADGQLPSSASSIKSERSFSSSSSSSEDRPVFPRVDHDQEDVASRTALAFRRGPCTCASRGVFLCTDCGQNLRAADTTYKRVWTWRSRYSTHIGGGLGTGLGQGNQGQKCGRGEHCLDSSVTTVCWVEIDCAEGINQEQPRDLDHSTLAQTGTPDYTNKEPGYFQQEIEGIGGVVKKKVKKRVKVGATVWEFEDERGSGKYLERESRGKLRSWCGWCGRVCPGEDDQPESWMHTVML